MRDAATWALTGLITWPHLVLGTSPSDGEDLNLSRNRLANEVSPYLLLHAHNPVNWYPWGEEAMTRARREDKPIFLSIGYSTCYWSHVMERLVFSDPEIAALMNEWFVNVKVDREERPDLDRIYMTATHLMTGRGGWPNSVFLTPDLEPFYAGTYFPPHDDHGRPGFPRVLHQLHQAWEARRDEVLQVAARVTAEIREVEAGQRAPPQAPDSMLVARSLTAITDRYDALNGGLGGPPSSLPACGWSSCWPQRIGSPTTGRWPGAASMTRWAAASIDTPPTRHGGCRTSRRCSTTRRTWSRSTCARTT